MGALSIVMFIWMVVTRIAAIQKAGIDPQEARDTSRLKSLPPEVVQVADNDNHLFERPTLFYATALAIALLGHVVAVHLYCAWAFVGLRIVHSLVRATINVVPIRFSLFAGAWLALGIMVLRELARTVLRAWSRGHPLAPRPPSTRIADLLVVEPNRIG